MATGIVSIGLHADHQDAMSVLLLWLAGLAYAVLVIATAYRLVSFRSELATDLADPARGFGFFTFVAGTDVLGARLALDAHHRAALALLAVGWVAWIVLGYVVPWTAVLGRPVRPVLESANGSWFIWVVASQSVATLAATLQPVLGGGRRELALVAVFSWSVGAFLYPAVAMLVGTRLLLYPLRPAELTPPYWVSMGATAITVVAGAAIVDVADAPDGRRHPRPGRRHVGALLGIRHLAHPGARRRRRLAARDPPGPAALRADAVEHRLPARHVRRGR
jgi:tellurite resistance protein TehA-like permease